MMRDYLCEWPGCEILKMGNHAAEYLVRFRICETGKFSKEIALCRIGFLQYQTSEANED